MIKEQKSTSSPRKVSNAEVGKAFDAMVKSARQDLLGVLMNWRDYELNEDNDRIIGYPGRDRLYSKGNDGGKVNISKREFMRWLASNGPFDTTEYGPDIAANQEWIDQISKLRTFLPAGFGAAPASLGGVQNSPKWFGNSKAVDTDGNGQELKNLVLEQYAPKSIERIETSGMLAAKTVSTKKIASRPIFIMRGNFGREQFKQAVAEAKTAGIENFDKMYVYADLAPYSGKMIDFTRLDEVVGIDRLPNEPTAQDSGGVIIDLFPVDARTEELVQEQGEPVASKMDAERRLSAGERIFAMHEQDETLSEITSVSQIKAWSSDQLIALSRDSGGAPIAQTDRRAFKNWFGDSKVVEPDGSPMVVFHNTNADFTTFKKGIRSGLAGNGIYFSEYPLPQFGNRQIKAYLKIENPITRATELPGMRVLNSAGIPTKFIDDIFEKFPEFDGIINRSEIVVKSPSQIKSATDNNGDFSRSNSDIRYSLADDEKGSDVVVSEASSLPSFEQTEQSTAYAAAIAAGKKRHALRILHAALEVEKEVDFTVDRGGAHSPSGPDDGSPLYDVCRAGSYPEDLYSFNGLRYYATGEDVMDREAYGYIQKFAAHPNMRITVYRAVEPSDENKIQPGAWVTTVRKYAKEHGEGVLAGKYKIIKKEVYARDIFTSGDSWLEWGYHPQEFKPELAKGERSKMSLDERLARLRNTPIDQGVVSAFEQWFGDSKVVAPNGEPLVVYHGTSKSFEAFDRKKIGSNYGADEVGFFFTSDPREATYAAQDSAKGNGGEQILPVYLSLKNPLTHTTSNWASDWYDTKGGWLMNKALEEGHDGIIIHGDGSSLYIAMNPNQIKSAIGNTGDFDRHSPGIRFSFADSGAASADRHPFGSVHGGADDAYLKAVFRGNLKVAQAIIDKAAQAAGYSTEAFHAGTVVNRFDVRNVGKGVTGVKSPYIYFGSDRNATEFYADAGTDRITRRYFLKTDGFVAFDNGSPRSNADDASVAAFDSGDQEFVGAVTHDVVDGDMEMSVYTIPYNENGSTHLAKLADAVVYDNNGGLILPSQRFGAESEDLRFGGATVDAPRLVQKTSGHYDWQAACFRNPRASPLPGKSSVFEVCSAISAVVGMDIEELPKGIGKFLVVTSDQIANDWTPVLGSNFLASLGADTEFQRVLGEAKVAQSVAIESLGSLQHGTILKHTTEEKWMAIFPDVVQVGRWRVIDFDPHGISGQSWIDGRNVAIACATRLNFTEPDNAALERLTSTPAFQRGLYATELLRQARAGKLTYLTVNEKMVCYDKAARVMITAGRATAQAFYDPKTDTTAFIADRINQGEEAAIFLHETTHKYGPKTLGSQKWRSLVGCLKSWSDADPSTVEHKIWQVANRRATKAGVVGAVHDEELIAYGVEEAVKRGIKPSALAREDSAAGWLAAVVESIKAIGAKLLDGGFGELQAQDLVDLTYALAQLNSPERSEQIRQSLGGEMGEFLMSLREVMSTSAATLYSSRKVENGTKMTGESLELH